MSRQAVFLGGAKQSLAQSMDLVRLAESLGYESAWVSQIADREATIVAAAWATATSTIRIATGVVPVYPRTPLVMAQTAASLDELSGGRFILGVGTSHQVVIETWHGLQLSRPVATMREYVGAVRALLRGQVFLGDIYRSAFSFIGYRPPRAELPIYISCLSGRMCELAGEIADGAILWMCPPGYIREVVVPHLARGRERVGRSMEGFEVVAAVPVAVSEDRAQARSAFRRTAAVYWSRAAAEGAGLGRELALLDQKGPDAIPDETVDAFAATGSPQECRAAIEEYRSAGVSLPVLAALPGHRGFAGIEGTLEALA